MNVQQPSPEGSHSFLYKVTEKKYTALIYTCQPQWKDWSGMDITESKISLQCMNVLGYLHTAFHVWIDTSAG